MNTTEEPLSNVEQYPHSNDTFSADGLFMFKVFMYRYKKRPIVMKFFGKFRQFPGFILHSFWKVLAKSIGEIDNITFC